MARRVRTGVEKCIVTFEWMELKRLAQEGRQASCLTNDEAVTEYQDDIFFAEIVAQGKNLPMEEGIILMGALKGKVVP
jgi:hypothetical protein